MTKEDAQIAEIFLRLKAKAANNELWTNDEIATVELAIRKEGEIAILAACCVLVSGHADLRGRAFGIFRQAIELNNPSPYVDLSIYEAATCIDIDKLVPFRNAILSFIKRSLMQRAVNLDNTVYLLGKLARTGDNQALTLLRSLARDSDSEVRDNVSCVLRGIERQPMA